YWYRSQSRRFAACATLSALDPVALGHASASHSTYSGWRGLAALCRHSVFVQSPSRYRPDDSATIGPARPVRLEPLRASQSVWLANERVASRWLPIPAAALWWRSLPHAPWRPAMTPPANVGPCRSGTTRF